MCPTSSNHPAGSNLDQALQMAADGMALHNHGTSERTVIQSIGAKLGKAKNTSIDMLPTEVLQQVLSYFKDNIWEPRYTNDKYPILKTMRLVNSAFNKVASPFLFRNVVLYEHTKCYAALNNIANVPYLAPLVEGVQLAQLGYLPDHWFLDEEKIDPTHDCQTDECGSFEYWQLFRNRTEGSCLEVQLEPPAGGPMAKLNFSPEETYKRYIAWRDGERIMKKHVRNGTAPSLDLDLLHNFRHIETVGLSKMRVIKRKWGQQSETRRFCETGLIEENALKDNRYVPLCHLPTFLIAASVCSKNLTSLSIHRLDELFKGEEYNNDNPALQLRSLRSLGIDLADLWYSYDYLDDPTQLAPWVHNLQNLEELQIYQNGQRHYGQADVLRLLRHVSLPKLAKFSLHDGLVGYKVLKTFLSKHNATLRLIDIEKPIMEQERWEKLRERYILGAPLAHGKEVRLSKFPHWRYFTDRDEGEKREFGYNKKV